MEPTTNPDELFAPIEGGDDHAYYDRFIASGLCIHQVLALAPQPLIDLMMGNLASVASRLVTEVPEEECEDIVGIDKQGAIVMTALGVLYLRETVTTEDVNAPHWRKIFSALTNWSAQEALAHAEELRKVMDLVQHAAETLVVGEDDEVIAEALTLDHIEALVERLGASPVEVRNNAAIAIPTSLGWTPEETNRIMAVRERAEALGVRIISE